MFVYQRITHHFWGSYFTITFTRLSPWSSSNPPSFTAKYGKIGGGKPVNEHLNPDATDATPKKSDLSQPKKVTSANNSASVED